MSESAIKSPDEVARNANRLILDGDVGGALGLLKSHLLQDPLESKLTDLVDSLLEGAALIEFYRDLQKSAPDDWRLVMVLAAAYSRSGKDSLAVVQLQKLLRTDSDHPEVWMALAQCYRRLDKAELALRALNSLIDLQPQYPQAHVTRLLYLLESGDLEEATAASVFSLEVKALPPELLSWLDKVNLYLEQGLKPPAALLEEQEERAQPEPEPAPSAQPQRTSNQQLSQREKTQQLLSFTNMLAIMVKGGLSFGRIFGILASKQCSLTGSVIKDLEKSVMRDGEPLSKALAHHPEIFSDQYLALVEMGESTNLSRCLDRLCEQLKLEYLRSEPKDDSRPALILSCRNLVDALEASGSEIQALGWAVRACADDKIRAAMQELEKQVSSGIRLAECKFPPIFTPLITSLLVAHDAVGTTPNAFKDLARLLTR
ncbi:MAG: type II secretion system F family protein [Candidatus Eremiobacteraeota bacterium]|nr:type II secretion system F family protein [Candidatus Eremiobacteraeota bacterium]MCW5866953.1 type II secretion system F family protein [Candidatus Eremiobacteraeota bacterium]